MHREKQTPERVAQENPCTVFVTQARSLIWERRHMAALELLEKTTFHCDASIEVLLMKGDIFYTLKERKKAASTYKRVLDQDPGNHHAIVGLWFLDAQKSAFTETEKLVLKTKALEHLSNAPNDPEAVYAAVLGLEGARDVPEKTAVIEKHVHLVKNDSWKKDLAEIYFYDTLRTPEEDLVPRATFFRKTFPNNRLRYNMAHMLLSHLGRNKDKRLYTEITDLMKKEPGNRVLNYLCARTILDMDGDLDQAKKFIKKAIKAAAKPDPEDRYEYIDDAGWEKLMETSCAEYYAVDGRIKYLQKDTSGAIMSFHESLRHDVRCHSTHLWYGMLLEKTGDAENALQHYRLAAELKDSPDAEAGMKRILVSRGVQKDPGAFFAEKNGMVRFSHVTEQAGIKDASGTRVSWGYINGDGFPDLVVAGRKIFLNNGDGTFREISVQAGIIHDYPSGGVLADFDKNNKVDLLSFTSKGGPRLYLNRTNNSDTVIFEDATEKALPPWPDRDWKTEAAAAADVDMDGKVDVYISNFEKSGPERGLGIPDIFYRNMGKGIFEDATHLLINTSRETMCGRGAAFADVNGDRRPDLFVANYRLDPDFLYINQKTDTPTGFQLVDQAQELGVQGINVKGAYGHSIGGAWGYLDKDKPFLFVAALSHPRFLGLSDISALYVPSANENEFERHFKDMGFVYQETHSDPSFCDVDLDGDLDLFITSIYPNAPSFLYMNHNNKFSDVSWVSGVRVYNGWGAAWADYDCDGDMDLAVCAGKIPMLFRNEAQMLNRKWLEVKIKGGISPTSGIGTKVIVQSADGKIFLTREIHAGRGTGNQDDTVAHFGLGTNRGPFQIQACFSSGRKIVLSDIPCGQFIRIIEP